MSLTSPLNAVHAAKVFAEAGIIRPYRPSRLLQLSSTLLSWGIGTAGGSVALATRFPDATGVIDDLGSLTFEEIHRRSNALARGLTAFGVREGDAVAVMCRRNHRYFVEASFAVARLGADLLYLNTAFAGPPLVDVLDREKPAVIVYDEEFTDLVEGVHADLARVLAWTEVRPSPVLTASPSTPASRSSPGTTTPTWRRPTAHRAPPS